MAKVLIADDIREDVQHLIEAIEHRQHEVVYCACSRDAQEEIGKGEIYCGIYDIMMPRYLDSTEVSAILGGILLARETRHVSPNVKFVFHTSGLEGALKEEIYALDVPVFIKNENRVGDIIQILGL